MKLRDKLIVRPGRKIKLSGRDPGATPGVKNKQEASGLLRKNIARMAELQYLLYAENKRALLIVLQAMDAGGKDGTIRHVMSGMNPQGCRVTSFKVPSAEEADHDYLWRIHRAVPPRGEIGIFNRSHYEEVLVVRVHRLVPRSVWSERYDQINSFERHLHDNDIRVIKFFLHISKDEQKERIQARIDDPTKHWKLSKADLAERRHWNDYTKAFEDAMEKCSTRYAPWYVIPANRKWYRNLAVSEIIVETLEDMKMKFPKPTVDVSTLRVS